MSIGSRIRARRIELGMSQDELAQKLGYKSRSSINKIEMGTRDLTQSKIEAIANALDTTPCYIMGWKEHHKGDDTQSKRRIKLVDTPENVDEMKIFELIESKYGKETAEAFSIYIKLSARDRAKFAALVENYTRLDNEDRLIFIGRIFQIVEDMLESAKYSRKEGYCGG